MYILYIDVLLLFSIQVRLLIKQPCVVPAPISARVPIVT